MKDTYQRRNRIAAIVCNQFYEQALALQKHSAEHAPDKPCLLDVRAVLGAQKAVFAALAGETLPEHLGIDPLSFPALQIASLTTEPTQEPS